MALSSPDALFSPADLFRKIVRPDHQHESHHALEHAGRGGKAEIEPHQAPQHVGIDNVGYVVNQWIVHVPDLVKPGRQDAAESEDEQGDHRRDQARDG